MRDRKDGMMEEPIQELDPGSRPSPGQASFSRNDGAEDRQAHLSP